MNSTLLNGQEQVAKRWYEERFPIYRVAGFGKIPYIY